mgnify:FL=1
MMAVLECHAHHEADAVLVGVLVVIVETADILYMDELEDVVDADGKLVIGLLAVHHMTALGEQHEDVALGVLLEERVVLVGQSSPQATESDVLAPLELLQQWYAVENLSVEIPRDIERGKTVVEELHVVDELEGLVLDDIAEVGLGHDEQRIGHLVPLDTALEIAVDLSPRLHPEALVDARLGEVVTVVATEESLDADSVTEDEHGGVEINLQSALLGVDICLAGGEAELGMELGGAELIGVWL